MYYICFMDRLITHIRKTINLDDSEAAIVSSYFEYETVKKKKHLVEEGQTVHKQYYILKGCLRIYTLNTKGNEQTLQFGIENWWIADYLGFLGQTPSNYFIQAVENSEVISIDKNSLDELLSQLPKLEKYFRLTFQKSLGAAQMRIKYLFTMTAEESYHHFNKNFPEFVQRVPQYMLATYLDFTPEFMSKIRAGKA